MWWWRKDPEYVMGRQHVTRWLVLSLFAVSSFSFLVVLWFVAYDVEGQTIETRLVWDMSWLAATVVVVLVLIWRFTTPPPGKDDDRILKELEEIKKLVQSNPKGKSGAGQQPEQKETASAQVLATLISSQDHITWLAFTLGMTSEVILINGFLLGDILPGFHWVFAVGGILVAGVFWNMVRRSNADMGALYDKADKKWDELFRIPVHKRRGISAGLVMNVAFGGWVLAWLTALAFSLNQAL